MVQRSVTIVVGILSTTVCCVIFPLPSSRPDEWSASDGSNVSIPGEYVFNHKKSVANTNRRHMAFQALSDVLLKCEPGTTKVRGELVRCKDRIQLEELFDNDVDIRDYDPKLTVVKNNVGNGPTWTKEALMPVKPEYEFALYRASQNNSKIDNGTLQITPVLLDQEYGESFTLHGNIDIGSTCTGFLPGECTRKALGSSILPPVISARLTTEDSFYFRYGKIEIRAKFPTGDWLYPELWLEPKYKSYGSGYTDGRVILALARGNERLFREGSMGDVTLGSSVVEFGLRTGPINNLREDRVTMKKDWGSWTDDFHVYTTIWDVNGFTFEVDGEFVGHIDPPSVLLSSNQSSNKDGLKIAPYENEFYITLGLGVGGVRVFPDWADGGLYKKPWKNTEAKAMLRFWKARDRWLPSWTDRNGVKSKFQVDYVRVWSV